MKKTNTLLIGVLSLLMLTLTGCGSGVTSSVVEVKNPFTSWLGNAASSVENFQLPYAPIGLSFNQENPDRYAKNLIMPVELDHEWGLFVMMGTSKVLSTQDDLQSWVWMPLFSQDDINTGTLKNWEASTLKKIMADASLSTPSSSSSKKEQTPKTFKALEKALFFKNTVLNETLIFLPDQGAFLFAEPAQNKLLPVLNEVVLLNQDGWGKKPKNSWRLIEQLKPIIKDTLSEFPQIDQNTENFTFINLGELINLNIKGKSKSSVKPSWMVTSDLLIPAHPSGLKRKTSRFLFQIPQLDDAHKKPVDLATLEYLFKGGERPHLNVASNVNYISIQNIDRMLKKGVIDNLAQDKQNQLKMLNPVLSLFHLNLEKDILGLFSKRSFFLVNDKGQRAVVLEPTSDKQKTLKALVKHLGEGGSLNDIVLKGKTVSSKHVIDRVLWKDQNTLLKLNEGLGLPALINPWRFYPSEHGIYLANQAFFTPITPSELNTYLQFDAKRIEPTPWVSFHFPNPLKLLQVAFPPVLREKNKALSDLFKELEDSGVVDIEGSLNLSHHVAFALSGETTSTIEIKPSTENTQVFIPEDLLRFAVASILTHEHALKSASNTSATQQSW
jgi:hypothetical protein